MACPGGTLIPNYAPSSPVHDTFVRPRWCASAGQVRVPLGGSAECELVECSLAYSEPTGKERRLMDARTLFPMLMMGLSACALSACGGSGDAGPGSFDDGGGGAADGDRNDSGSGNVDSPGPGTLGDGGSATPPNC